MHTRVLVAVLATAVLMFGGCGTVLYAGGMFTARPLAEGERVKVQARNGFGLWCGESEALARDPITREQQRADETLRRWVSDNVIWYLSQSTRVQVARVSADMASVQVLTGQHAGRVCWLPSSALSR
jgi:hypothetical protein